MIALANIKYGNLPFPASGSPSARIRLCHIDEPRTDSRERIPKNAECKIAMIVFVDMCGNLPFPASGSPSARIWQAILTNQGRFTREYQKDECKFCIRLFWYSRRESNPQLTLRRGLLYPFNYGSVYSVFSLFLDCTTFFKLCQFF